MGDLRDKSSFFLESNGGRRGGGVLDFMKYL